MLQTATLRCNHAMAAADIVMWLWGHDRAQVYIVLLLYLPCCLSVMCTRPTTTPTTSLKCLSGGLVMQVLFEPQRRDADMADPDDMLPKAPPEDNFHHILQYFLQQGGAVQGTRDGRMLVSATGTTRAVPWEAPRVPGVIPAVNHLGQPACLNKTCMVLRSR